MTQKVPADMRDLEALLESIVNIDRDSLIAILLSEAEEGRQAISKLHSVAQRFAAQKAIRSCWHRRCTFTPER